MFMVSEAETTLIRAAYLAEGADGAARELRRMFAGLPDNEETRASAVTIAGWTERTSGSRVPTR